MDGLIAALSFNRLRAVVTVIIEFTNKSVECDMFHRFLRWSRIFQLSFALLCVLGFICQSSSTRHRSAPSYHFDGQSLEMLNILINIKLTRTTPLHFMAFAFVTEKHGTNNGSRRDYRSLIP